MLLATVNQLPPFICRLIARKRIGRNQWNLKALSHDDLARLARMSKSSVSDLSRRVSWEGVPLDIADRFATACGVDLTHPARHLRWLKQGRFGHLKSGNAQQRRFFARLLSRK